jgi:acetate kinase
MGFTPLDGLMMSTRSGSLDPGILIYALRERGIDAKRLDHVLNHESGLLGVSELTADMRELLAAARSNPSARLAVDLYAHRIRQTIGAMAATLGGVDALIFTAGIGENAPQVRERVCENLGFLGLSLDPAANAERKPDGDIATKDSKGRILVLATREELMIAREVHRLLRQSDFEPSAKRKLHTP